MSLFFNRTIWKHPTFEPWKQPEILQMKTTLIRSKKRRKWKMNNLPHALEMRYNWSHYASFQLMGVASVNWLYNQKKLHWVTPDGFEYTLMRRINNRRNRAWFPGIAARIGSIPCRQNPSGIFIFFQRKLSCKSGAINRSLSRRERRPCADSRTFHWFGTGCFLPRH